MRLRLALACLAPSIFFAGTTAIGQRQEMWFPAGQPEFVEPSDPVAGAQQLLMTRAAYDRLVDRNANFAPLVPIREFPQNLSPNARFGVNFVWAGKNRGFVVDGDPTSGYTLYADMNANGSVLDDMPISMERRDGYFTALIQTTASETKDDETATVPIVMRLVVVPSNGELKQAISSLMIRRGTAQVGARRVAFTLRGRGGAYDEPTNGLWIDLDGDGRGFDDPTSPEFLRVRDQRVNIDGTGYEFRVDHHGRSLVLTPLATPAQERPSLKPGTPAPDFSLVDIDGHPQSLRQQRGKVVLLDFWAIWCGPCKTEAPVLKAIHDRYRDAGFVIIGLAPDTKEDIRKYIVTEGHTWSQIVEANDGSVSQLFRVAGYPTHVLVGRDGTIVMTKEGGIGDADTTFENQVKQALGR